MTAARLVADRTIRTTTTTVPTPGPGELQVEVLATGICGSDLAAFRGTHPYKKAPAILGHEVCGRVSLVPDAGSSRFRVGDLVCSAAYAPCGLCGPCAESDPHLCRDRSNLSHGGWDGSFAEYVILREASTFRLPPDLDPEIGALVEPLSIGEHAAALVAGQPRTAAILGCGPIGLACLLAVRRAGVTHVGGTDLGPEKGGRFRSLGGTAYADAGRGRAVHSLLAQLPGPVDVVLVASGYPTVMDDALALVRPGGQVVVVSYFESPHLLDLNAFVSHEVTLSFSALSSPADFARVIDGLTSGELDPGPMITHRLPLAQAGAALELLDGPEPAGKVLLISHPKEQR